MTSVYSTSFTVASDTNIDAFPSASPNNEFDYLRGSGSNLQAMDTNDRLEASTASGDFVAALNSNSTTIVSGKISTTGLLGDSNGEKYAWLCARCASSNHYLVEGESGVVAIYRYTGSYNLLTSASRSYTEPLAGSFEVTGEGATVSISAIWDGTAAVSTTDTAGSRLTTGVFGVGVGGGTTANVAYITDIDVDDLTAAGSGLLLLNQANSC